MHNPTPIWTEPEFPPLVSEPLSPAWDLGVAAQHIVLYHFREVLAQRLVVWGNAELEGVHQIRVAARRTRTALQTLGPLWPEAEVARFEKYLVRFATAFGVARDLDVMILYLEEQLAAAQGERAAAYRWLLERNRHKRQEQQPQLETVLVDMEQSAFPLAFVTYFSRTPCDLWALGAQHG
jgi:CHAD domain-containing protein